MGVNAVHDESGWLYRYSPWLVGGLSKRSGSILCAALPNIPDSPVIVEKTKGGIIELRWTYVNTSGSEPVLYIVDQRWSVGKHHSESHSSEWQQITQVHNLRLYYIVLLSLLPISLLSPSSSFGL